MDESERGNESERTNGPTKQGRRGDPVSSGLGEKELPETANLPVL